MKKFNSLFIVTIMCITLSPFAVVASEQPSSWAADQITRATYLDLVPITLRSGYTKPTTRAEFCALAVTLYENISGEEIVAKKTFADTTDANVQKMGGLGVVNGMGGDMFAPNDTLTREQAAVMLANLAKAVGKPLNARTATFADYAQISSWARTQAGQVQVTGIMSGVGNNNFAPKDLYTKEQSIATMLHLYDFLIVPVERVSVNLNKRFYEIGEVLEADVNIYPSNATYKSYTVTIESEGRVIGILPQNQHSFKLTETGTITVRVTASNGVENIQDVNVIDLYAFTEEVRQEFYSLVNSHRKSNGLRELEENKALQQYADVRAAELIVQFGHTRPDGSAAGSGWYNSQNYMNTRYAENAHWSSGYSYDYDPQKAALQIFTNWKESAGHNRHMLYEFNSDITMALGLYFKLDNGGFVTGAIWASGY